MIPETPHELSDTDVQFATPQEAREEIDNLQKADHAKLLLIARGFARIRLKGTVVEPDDLVHDAIVKTLDGRRRWNRRVTIIKHLDRVMESDAGHIAAKRVGRGTDQLAESHAEPATQEHNPEARLQIRDDLEDLVALFAEDKTALQLVRLKSDGLSASEIRCELGMEKTHYETVSKRIRRRLAKRLAEGGK